MLLSRRESLSLLALTGASLVSKKLFAFRPDSEERPEIWEKIHRTFNLDPALIHLQGLLLASHPRSVRKAIAHRGKLFDRNPVDMTHAWFESGEEEVSTAASKYLELPKEEIALTDSTTMGLGIVCTGLKIAPSEEVLTSTHDHPSMQQSLNFLASETQAKIVPIPLYENASECSQEDILNRIEKAIGPKTRYLCLTWVHSSTGVKLPIAQIADRLKEINSSRSPQERIYFIVDGVHGFGAESTSVRDLKCDVFIAGTHKWIFGPRGTGILWANEQAWERIRQRTVSFSQFMGSRSSGRRMTPGGFHSFEFRWALKEAFEFHHQLGKEKITKRVHALANQIKFGLKKIPHIQLHTPLSEDLSSGIVCFESSKLSPKEIVKLLRERSIIAGTTPYRPSFARLTPMIFNHEKEIEICLEHLAQI